MTAFSLFLIVLYVHLLLRILFAGVLLGELVLLDGDVHRTQIGLNAPLFVLGAFLDDPVVGADGQSRLGRGDYSPLPV